MTVTPERPHQTGGQDQDPSMDEILASIRRIMLEEQSRFQAGQPAPLPPATVSRVAAEDDAAVPPVLLLDESMAVSSAGDDGAPLRTPPPAAEAAAEARMPPPERFSGVSLAFDLPGFSLAAEPDAYPSGGPPPQPPLAVTMVEIPPSAPPSLPEGSGPAEGEEGMSGLTQKQVEELLAPAVAAAASSSVEALLRRLEAERQASLQITTTGSITLEEAVRSELRPMLKAWLDEHLADIVERVVKAEIARLTFRHTP
ncbi:DUF2497 domain-containing protein [Acidisoma sp. C75]